MRARQLAATTVAALVGGLALASCSLVDDLTGGGSSTDFTAVQLHPTGELGAWLDPGYASGIGEVRTVPGGVCGAAEGIVAVDDGAGTIVGYVAVSGSEAWRVPDTSCVGLEAAAGDLYLSRLTAEGSEYLQLDIATGEVQVFYSAPIAIVQTSTIGRGEDTVYLHADADVGPALTAFAFDGTLRWQAPIDYLQQCHLLGTHIGCASLDTFTVLDAATGEETIPETPIESGKQIIWAVGGYTLVVSGISMDVETTPIYDFNGAQIGTVDDAALPSTPAPTLGVAYDVGDLTVEGANSVWLTDAEGRSLVHWDDGLRLTASDATLPDDVMLVAGGADGSTVLYRDYLKQTLTLAASDGSALHTFEGGAGDLAQVLDGLLVESIWDGEMTTTIYPPGD